MLAILELYARVYEARGSCDGFLCYTQTAMSRPFPSLTEEQGAALEGEKLTEFLASRVGNPSGKASD